MPPPVGGQSKVELNISVDLTKILKFDEVEGSFRTKLFLRRQWLDPRLSYRNLKTERRVDLLSPSEEEGLRAPVVLSGWVRVPFGAFLSFYGVIKTAIGRPNQKSAEKCNTCLLVGVQINKKT